MAIKKNPQKPKYYLVGSTKRSPFQTTSQELYPKDYQSVEITTSKGKTISIELWERAEGEILVRGLNCCLQVKPHSANVVNISGVK